MMFLGIAIPKIPILLAVRPRLHHLMLCTLKKPVFQPYNLPPLYVLAGQNIMVLNYRDVNVGLLVTLIKVGWSVTTKPIILRKILLSTPSLSSTSAVLSVCLLNAFHCNTNGNESLFF